MTNRKKTDENSLIRETNSALETCALGELLGRQARPGQIYCLDGELGVGKTVFAQGFAGGNGNHGSGEQPDIYDTAAI